ncbi:unnamed protein product [Rotaria magnacalcarata]|uniref:Alpha/beta hydrolase fold-3 domain-containing protein n=2 Tax=Rotaria magnacalcarata TaxID=392030 RepID=A0A8S2K5N1_9BILA|nr:unnamed protein product [Rotaria magnacalcarata]
MQFPATAKEQDVHINREQAEIAHAKINEKLIDYFKGTLQEQNVQANSAEIPISIYTPVDVNTSKLVIFFHGGGWTVCSRKTHQTIVNMLADATKTVWISVEYRRGPEYQFPIWWNDSYEVTRHIIENKQSYGVDSSAKVGLAGDSGGAALSATISRILNNKIDFQILVYGIYDLLRRAPSYKEFIQPMYFLTPETLDWLTTSSFSDMKDLTDSRASALASSSFEGLPPSLFIVAELDPLRDDSYAYQKVLDQAGVKTKLVLIKGVTHAFISLPGYISKRINKERISSILSTTTVSSEESTCTAPKQLCIDVDDTFNDYNKENILD